MIRPLKETGEHSYHRRSFHHDYCAPFIYHIILKKQSGCVNFGRLVGDAKIDLGEPGCPMIKESPLGQIIAKALIHLPYLFPAIKLHQFCVMPDHVHIIFQVLFRTDRSLEDYMEELMNHVAKKYSKLHNRLIAPEEIFQTGFCDKPLYQARSLDRWYYYVSRNPYRLAVRKQNPEFFKHVKKLIIGHKEYEAYGNLFLLENPDKAVVKVSSKFSEKEKEMRRDIWLSQVAKGTVLVSPFVAPEESQIRAKAESLGGKMILITDRAFSERYQPPEHNFNLCKEGRLLIITLGEPPGTRFSRSLCLRMNALAEEIVTLF